MAPAHVKEALSLLGRVHLFAIRNEGDEILQHEIEGFINMVEDTTIRSKKQTSILNFFYIVVFYNMFMLYWSSRVKSVFILNIAYFLTLFVRKCLHILIKQRKRQKLKTENFDQKSEKQTPPNSEQF